MYAERWEFESALDELKAHQHGPRVVLRSKTPDGVRQEAWGHLCTHYTIRALMGAAAAQRGVDPDRISFTRTTHAARRSVRSGLGAATRTLAVALPATLAEICRELVPRRRLHADPRVVKRKMSGYGVKRSEHRRWPDHPKLGRRRASHRHRGAAGDVTVIPIRGRPPAWDILRQAIAERKTITARYHGHVRVLSPHVIGWRNGRAKLLSYQPAFTEDAGHQWRSMFIDELEDAAITDLPWLTAPNYTASASGIDLIELAVPHDQTTRVPAQTP